MKAKHAGILSAIVAATCCLGPLLLVAIGLGVGAAFLGRYHWFFLIGGIAVLAWAWAKYVREKTICDCERKPMPGQRGTLLILLIGTAIVLGFGALNISRYGRASEPVAARRAIEIANGLNRIVI